MATSSPMMIPQATDYRPIKTLTPTYKFSQVVPQVAPPATLTAAQSEISFLIPGSSVMNLALTRFRIGLRVAATALNYTVFHAAPPLYRVQLVTSKNVILVDISDYRVFHKAAVPACVSRDELQAMTIAQSAVAALPAGAVGSLPSAGPLIVGANAFALSATGRAPGVGSLSGGCVSSRAISAGIGANAPYAGTAVLDFADKAPQMYYGTNDVNVASALAWDVQLQHLVPHSILSVLQDLYFGEDLTLRLTLLGANEVGFATTNMHTLAAAANFAANSVTVTPNSCNLWVAYQDNKEIAGMVMQKVLSDGLQMPVQSVTTFQNSAQFGVDNAITSSVTNTLSAGYGRSVLRSYTIATNSTAAPYRAANAFNTMYYVDQANVADVTYGQVAGQCDKFDFYQSYLNQRPTSDSRLSMHDVWDRQSDLLRNTPLANQSTWQAYSSVIIEDWSGLPHAEQLRSITPEGGLSLMVPLTHTVDIARIGANGPRMTTWQFYVMARILRLTADGAQIL